MARQTLTIPASDNDRLLHIDTSIVLEDVVAEDPNLPPVVKAGENQTIQLPKTDVLLIGNATDPDGTIQSVLWQKISGPSWGTIETPSQVQTKVNGLAAGVYVFRFTATDNDSSKTYAETTVTVKEAVTVDPIPTGYSLTYQNSYDKLSDLDPNQIGIRDESELSLMPRYLDTVVTKNSPGSFKSIVPSGGNGLSSGNRSEQQYNEEKQNPTEGIVELDILFRSGPLLGEGTCIQWHPNNSGSSLVGLHTTKGKFQVFRSIDLVAGNVRNAVNYYQTGTLKSIEVGRWYKLQWWLKWSTGKDGYVKLYIDGILYYSFTGRTQDSDGKPYLKPGQNRWGNLTGESIVNIDNLKIYKRA